jgi:hypothetical protein
MSWEAPKYSWDNYYEDNASLFTTPEVEEDFEDFFTPTDEDLSQMESDFSGEEWLNG